VKKGSRQRQKEETTIKIVQAAEYLFGTLGHRGTSIQRVADHAGISKQALMHHFPTKQSLCEAVLAQVVTFAGEFMGGVLLQINQPDQEDLLINLVRRFAQRPYWAQYLVRELLEGKPGELPDFVYGIQRQFVEHLQREQQNGTIDPSLDVEATLANLNLLLLTTLATLDQNALSADQDPEEWMKRRLVSVLRFYKITLFAR